MDITDEEELEEYSVEIDILSQFQHKNVVGIYEAYYFNSKLSVSILIKHWHQYYCETFDRLQQELHYVLSKTA